MLLPEARIRIAVDLVYPEAPEELVDKVFFLSKDSFLVIVELGSDSRAGQEQKKNCRKDPFSHCSHYFN